MYLQSTKVAPSKFPPITNNVPQIHLKPPPYPKSSLGGYHSTNSTVQESQKGGHEHNTKKMKSESEEHTTTSIPIKRQEVEG